MSVDREYNVKIHVGADGSGAEQAAQGLKDTGKATEGLAAAEADGAKAAGKSEISHRALHEALHLVGKVGGPEAEAALGSLAAAGTGEITVLLVAIGALVELFDRLQKKAEETRATMAAVWLAIQTGAHDAAEAAADYEQVLGRLPSSLDAINNQYAAQKTILDDEAKAHGKILDALEKEQLAAAEGDKEKQEAIKRFFEGAKSAADLAAENKAIVQQLEEVDALSTARDAAKAKADRAEKQFEESKTKPEEVVRAETDTTANQKAFERANAYIQHAGGAANIQAEIERVKGITHGLGNTYSQDLQTMLDVVEKQKAQRKIIDDWNSYSTRTADAAKTTQSAWEELNKKIGELNTSIDTSQKAFAIHQRTTQQEQEIANVTAAGGPGAVINAEIPALQAYQSGQKLTASQVQQLATFRDLFDSVNTNAVEVVDLTKKSLAAHLSTAQIIAGLQAQYDALLGVVEGKGK